MTDYMLDDFVQFRPFGERDYGQITYYDGAHVTVSISGIKDFGWVCSRDEAGSNIRYAECPACRAKPGTPTLCAGCLERRARYEMISERDAKRHKRDKGKAPWNLLPWGAVGDVVAIIAHGAEKYGANTWQKVPDARERYFSATQRHLLAWWGGESRDPESGLPHLAHAACNVLFLAAFERGDT